MPKEMVPLMPFWNWQDFSYVKDRTCKGCVACCRIEGVPDGPPCSHIKDGGCGIYEERPHDCRQFVCLWRAGRLDMRFRPEDCGVVSHIGVNHAAEKVGLNVHEVEPGALDARRNILLVRQCEEYSDYYTLVTFEYLDGRTELVCSDQEYLTTLRLANPMLRDYLPKDGRVYLKGRREPPPTEENDVSKIEASKRSRSSQ